jgi:23S rRNA (guanosine2251-2'-O)-methyltransferase
MNKFQDSEEFLKKKSEYRQLLTIYGRKPVLEALNNSSLSCFRLHLADSNKASKDIQAMEKQAQARQIEVKYHNRQALSRISKNGKQDQGVCLDIRCQNHQNFQDFIKTQKAKLENSKTHLKLRVLALDRITNPQNLGMIIRSACAGNMDGILYAEKGCARIDSLVIKASAGTLFKAPLIKCDDLAESLKECSKIGASIIGLSGHGKTRFAEIEETKLTVYVLGNETDGVSNVVERQCNQMAYIPMHNDVESLNVAVTASLIAFRNEI